METFEHRALGLQENKNLVYTAMSKHLFYFRMHISKYVIEQHKVPLNPFMTFEYFMLDTVKRDLVREANNNLVMRSDELWVFGPVADGVLAEIKTAKLKGKPVKYFKITKYKDIIPI
jgi:hypothetical protein